MKISLLRFLFYFLSFHFCVDSHCQNDSLRAKAIRDLSQAVRNRYFDKAVAFRMADKVEEQFRAGAYDTAYNMNEFFYLVTKDLRSVCDDDHVRVEASFTPYPDDRYYDSLNSLSKRQRKKSMARMKARIRAYNRTNEKEAFLLGDIIRMGDHTGYLQVLRLDGDPKRYEKYTLRKAASFLSGTDNLIIDLRGNSGGKLLQLRNFISYFITTPGSYLFLSSTEYRYDSLEYKKTFQLNDKYYSVSSIPRTFFQKKIFVLIDRYTFSAAEGIAYLLKKLYPNTMIIGEPTAGGTGCGRWLFTLQIFRCEYP